MLKLLLNYYFHSTKIIPLIFYNGLTSYGKAGFLYILGNCILLTIKIARVKTTANNNKGGKKLTNQDIRASIPPAKVMGIPIKLSFMFKTLKRASRKAPQIM